jgi:glycosyltransferase involved in cell wall biosynthesis
VHPSPRVAVIIPLYNLRAFVRDAIESALAQTLAPSDLEVVVIDDGSTDDGGAIARTYEPHIRYIRQDNRGLSAARNRGIRESCAPFLAFLDADDRFLPGKLAAQLTAFDAHPELGLVYTGFRYIDAGGAPLPQRGWSQETGDLLPRLVRGNVIHPVQALVRREPVERAGGFDETLTSAEDWDLWLRLSRHGLTWGYVDHPLAEYRVRTDAMHENPERMCDNRLRVLDKVFADPTLPADLAGTRPLAYHSAYLVAACEHFRAGHRTEGNRCFRAAVELHPGLLTAPDSLRRFCRWLLPLGYQRTPVMVADWRRLWRILRGALTDLFAARDLDDNIARLRWQARLASWRALAPLVRKRLTTRTRATPLRIAAPH